MSKYDLPLIYDDGEYRIEAQTRLVRLDMLEFGGYLPFLIATTDEDMDVSYDISFGDCDADAVLRWSYWGTNLDLFEMHTIKQAPPRHLQNQYYRLRDDMYLPGACIDVEEVDIEDIYILGDHDAEFNLDVLNDAIRAKYEPPIVKLPFRYRETWDEIDFMIDPKFAVNDLHVNDFVTIASMRKQQKNQPRKIGKIIGFVFKASEALVNTSLQRQLGYEESYEGVVQQNIFDTVGLCLVMDDSDQVALEFHKTSHMELYESADLLRWFFNHNCSAKSLLSVKNNRLPINLPVVSSLTNMGGDLEVLPMDVSFQEVRKTAAKIEKARSIAGVEWSPPGTSQPTDQVQELGKKRRRTFLDLTADD